MVEGSSEECYCVCGVGLTQGTSATPRSPHPQKCGMNAAAGLEIWPGQVLMVTLGWGGGCTGCPCCIAHLSVYHQSEVSCESVATSYPAASQCRSKLVRRVELGQSSAAAQCTSCWATATATASAAEAPAVAPTEQHITQHQTHAPHTCTNSTYTTGFQQHEHVTTSTLQLLVVV